MKSVIAMAALLVTAPIASFAEWETTVEVDPFTDAKQAFAYVAFVDGTPAGLTLRCFDGRFEILVNFGEKVTGLEVRYRAGKGAAQSGIWEDSSTQDAVFHPSPEAFVAELESAEPKTLVIRVMTHGGQFRVSHFDIAGIGAASKTVREACEGQPAE